MLKRPVSRDYKFPELLKTVEEYVTTCDVCQRVTAERQAKRGTIQPLMIPERRWQSVHMDWVLGLPPYPAGGGSYDAVHTFTDRATKMVHLMPTTDKVTAAEAARLFIDNVVKLHDVPEDFR